jgi:hypothetical protein
MDRDAIALTMLREDMQLRQRRHAAGPRPANEAMTPQIKMIVSNWYTDELGHRARIIKARGLNEQGRPKSALLLHFFGAVDRQARQASACNASHVVVAGAHVVCAPKRRTA